MKLRSQILISIGIFLVVFAGPLLYLHFQGPFHAHPVVEPNYVPELVPNVNLSADEVMKSVVHIKVSTGEQGSGVYIGDGLILTAGHIVSNGHLFVVTFENEPNAYTSTNYYTEPAADVGFIYLGDDFNDVNIPALTFSDVNSVRDDPVRIFGHPFGWAYNFSVSRGIISSISRDCKGFFGKKIMLQSDAATYPGNSGGPVTNNRGKIVGILVGINYGSECLSLCIPAKICQQARKTYLSILEMEKLK